MQCEFYTPRDFIFRKVTDSADARMRSRTAKEQLADAIQAGRAPNDVPDAEDESTTRTGVLS